MDVVATVVVLVVVVVVALLIVAMRTRRVSASRFDSYSRIEFLFHIRHKDHENQQRKSLQSSQLPIVAVAAPARDAIRN
jgi:hypothetical protein